MAIKFPKKQEQRLIPKYLLEYAEELHENHPDPTAEWGGSGVADIEAGTGIEITGETTKTISLDTTPDTFEVTASTGTTIEVENENPLYKDAKLQMTNAGSTRLEGTQISLEANNIYLNSDNAPYYVNNTTHEYKQLATTDQLFSGDYNDLYNKPDLSVYELKSEAFSGDYNDLTNKPSIPTKTSDLTNDSGYITSSDIPTNYVTTDTAQTVTGAKTFRKTVKVQQANSNTRVDVNPNNIWVVDSDNNDNTIISNNGLSTTLNNTQTVQLERTTYQRDNIAKVSPQNFTITQKDTFSDSTYKTYTFDKTKEGIVAVTSDIPTDISAFNNDSGYITGITSSDVTTALGYTPGTSNFSGDYDDLTDKPDLSVYELKSEAFSGDYNDLTNKPTIPTVGNGTITIKKNNTTVDTFTTNQSTNKSINITVPTDTSDLTNGAGFITAAQVPAGWEVVEVTQSQGAVPVSAADLAKLAGDNVCIKYNLDAIGPNYYELYYKKGDPDLYGGDYCFDSFNFNYSIGTSYVGFMQIRVNATTGAWNATTDNRAYAGHKIASGSGLVEGLTDSYGRTLSIDTTTVALKTDIPTKTSQLTNNSGFITSSALSGYATETYVNTAISGLSIPTKTSELTNDSGFITGITSSDVTTALGYTPGTSNFSGDYDDLTDKPDLSIYAQSANLATVATTGSYNDLTNKPTIPTVNDNTITITQGGVTKGSFTLNQNTNQTIDVDDVPGMVGEVIYNVPNGEQNATSLTMSHSFADYEYVDIQYRIFDSADYVQSARIYDPNGKMISLDWKVNTDWTNSNVYGKCSRYTLSGTTMSIVNESGYEFYNNTMGSVTHEGYQYQILITKVVGYKQNNAPIVIPFIPDIYYHDGDKYINSNGYYNVTGYLTGSGKQIQLQITTAKSLANITSITVNKLAPVLRGVSGYVNGNSYLDYVTTSGYTVTANKATDNSFNIIIMATTAYSGGNNNTPINAVFNTDGLEVTFNE